MEEAQGKMDIMSKHEGTKFKWNVAVIWSPRPRLAGKKANSLGILENVPILFLSQQWNTAMLLLQLQLWDVSKAAKGDKFCLPLAVLLLFHL